MGLASPSSAILSAVIFNALIIVFLIPLALKGVKYRAIGAAALLRRNLLIYGLGGLIVPFIGIKLIDLLLAAVAPRLNGTHHEHHLFVPALRLVRRADRADRRRLPAASSPASPGRRSRPRPPAA